MDILSAVVTLFLIMDPLGNIPLFLSVLKSVRPERRRRVLLREIAFAYLVLLASLFIGGMALRVLGLRQETISVAGGIVLFLIALDDLPVEGVGRDSDRWKERPFSRPTRHSAHRRTVDAGGIAAVAAFGARPDGIVVACGHALRGL